VVRTTARSASSSLALVTILTLLLAAVGHQPARAQTTPTEDPAEAAAGWLVSALTDDPAVGSDFGPSAGPTIDVLFALAAAGVAAGTIEDIADWLVTQAPSYTQGDGFDADDAAYAGASAKLALGMLVVDRDPGDVAGIDLIDQLLSLEVTDPSDGIVGRFRDRSDFGDFSTPLTQSLALMALSRAPGADPSAEAITALVDQACPDGGFPSQFAPDTCTSSVDTTGFVVQALFAVGEDVAASAAVSWLESVQAADGSFASPDGTNTNSTGLAAIALTLGGATDAAASAGEWIVSQQDGCDTDSPGAIPFNQQERGSVELASAQAVVGLVGESLADLSNAGARAEVPTLACETVGGDDPVDDDGSTPPPGGSDEPDESGQDQEAVADEGHDADNDDDLREIPQPTRVDSGLSPSLSTTPMLVLLLGFGLLSAGLMAGLRQRGQRP
jgi:hypothetical protein